MQEQYESSLSEGETIPFTDKLVGIFTEPLITFTKIAKSPAKTGDWFIPLILYVVVSVFSTLVQLNNPNIRLEQKQQIETQLQKMVDEGKISQEQANQQLEVSNKLYNSTFFYLITSISQILTSFFWFFIISAFFMFLVKLLLGGQGSYKNALVAYGLSLYVLIVQSIVIIIISLVTGKMYKSTGVAAFLNLDKQSLSYFILAKLDVFSIWFYTTVSIGFAKMFNSHKTKKYVFLIIGIWIGFSLLIFVISKFVPYLQNFN